MRKKISLILAAVCLTAVLAAVIIVLVINNLPAAKVSEDKILNKRPFELSDNAEWRFYPPDNLAGIVALAQDHDDTDQTFVLVFNHSPKQKYADTVILKGDLVCTCFYDHYDFDNQEIVEKGGLYYMKMSCDKRITVVSFGFNLGNGNIREYVGVEFFGYDSVPKMKLYYSRFDYSYPQNTPNIRKTQLFNEKTGTWDAIEEVEETTEQNAIDYHSWTELQVDDDANEHSVTHGDITVAVSSYHYTWATYNVYHELKTPQVTTICFLVATDSDEGVEGIKEFDINNISTDDIRLYVKEDGEYVDITPGDLWLETDSWNSTKVAEPDVWVESCRFINLNSNELGELGEHEYRLVIMDYTIDFTLRVQFFEVW